MLQVSDSTLQQVEKFKHFGLVSEVQVPSTLRSTNPTSLEESFQHLNILYFPKLYTLSGGKFIHFYLSTTNFFQTILMAILFQSALFVLTPQEYLFLTTCFYLELAHLQGNIPLHFLVQKCGLQYQTLISHHLYLQMATKKYLLHKKDT